MNMHENLGPQTTPWEPPNKDRLTPAEYLRALEIKLSALIDEKDEPGWKVNPAFDPEVLAFIQAHANNAAFVKKAQSLQQNRAQFFVAARAQAENPKPRQRLNRPKVDRFGHRIDAPPGQINAVLSELPQTAEEIARRCNLPVDRVLQHFDMWFGTDRPLGRCLRRAASSSRAGERYWLEEGS